MKSYTRFSPNSICISLYNIELGLRLYWRLWRLFVGVGLGLFLFGGGWLGLVCMEVFCWVVVVGGVARIFLDICPRGLRYFHKSQN